MTCLIDDIAEVILDYEIKGLKPCTVYAWDFEPAQPLKWNQLGFDPDCTWVIFCGDVDITKLVTDEEAKAIVVALMKKKYR